MNKLITLVFVILTSESIKKRVKVAGEKVAQAVKYKGNDIDVDVSICEAERMMYSIRALLGCYLNEDSIIDAVEYRAEVKNKLRHLDVCIQSIEKAIKTHL